MKNLIVIVFGLAILFLAFMIMPVHETKTSDKACIDPNQVVHMQDFMINGYCIERVIFDGHIWLFNSGSGGLMLCHHPDCPCLKASSNLVDKIEKE